MSTATELIQTHELFWNLTLRELRTRYKRSALGWVWSMLNPLTTMLVYSFVFVVLLETVAPIGNPSGLDSYALYIVCAILPWNFFAVGVSTSMGTIIANGSLVTKVAFRREHLVLANVAASLITLFIEVGVLSVVLVFFGNVVLLQLPGVVLAAVFLTMFVTGMSMMMSALNVFFRDLGHLWGIATQVWFFLTPVIYPPEIVRDKVSEPLFWVYEHLPMAVAVQLFRNLLYDVRYPTPQQFLYLAVWGAFALLIGFRVFQRLAPRFPEEL